MVKITFLYRSDENLHMESVVLITKEWNEQITSNVCTADKEKDSMRFAEI